MMNNNLLLGLNGLLVVLIISLLIFIHVVRNHTRIGCQHCNRIRCNCNRNIDDTNWQNKVNHNNTCGM